MTELGQKRVALEKLSEGDEFPPVSLVIDGDRAREYSSATETPTDFYEADIVPPMAVAALAMTAISAAMVLPPGSIHVSQTFNFVRPVKTGEPLTSQARVVRKMERGRFRMLSIGITVSTQQQETVLEGETGFILATESI